MVRGLWGAAAFVAALGAFLSAGFAQSLEDALAMAYANNPTLEARRAELRATDEFVPQALSGWRPTVTVSAEVGKSEVETESSFFSSDETRTPQSYSLDLQQPIYRGGRTLSETQRAEYLIEAAQAGLLSIEQDVLFDGVTAYMDTLRDQAVIELSINNERVLERQLQATRDRFEVGEVTRTDVSQAEARLSQAIADRIQAEGNLISTRSMFMRVIGLMPAGLDWPEPAAELPALESTAYDVARNQHPDVAFARSQERAAHQLIRSITGELLPELNLLAGLTRTDDQSTRDSSREAASISARLTVPLYQSGVVYSRVREARERAGQRRIEIDEAERGVVEEATRAWEALATARAEIAAFTDQVHANEVALEGVEQEALVGLRTVLDVLDAEQELFESRINLVRAERDEVVASYRLKSAVGELTVVHLGLPVPIYDPTGHREEVRGMWFGLGGD
ncbi:MAG: TolC family outer membrane protein [Proteobacteria bacterium]|nr:TolC family outer membrane protein [Pseudomonadota bacterium]